MPFFLYYAALCRVWASQRNPDGADHDGWGVRDSSERGERIRTSFVPSPVLCLFFLFLFFFLARFHKGAKDRGSQSIPRSFTERAVRMINGEESEMKRTGGLDSMMGRLHNALACRPKALMIRIGFAPRFKGTQFFGGTHGSHSIMSLGD